MKERKCRHVGEVKVYVFTGDTILSEKDSMWNLLQMINTLSKAAEQKKSPHKYQ